MRIWLPPSEGKAKATSGPKLVLSKLSHPELLEARLRVLTALKQVSGEPGGVKMLKLGPKSAGDMLANLELFASACLPAEKLYQGVLFERLDAESLDEAARQEFLETTWIFSAAFGILGPADPVPYHRLSMGVSLPSLGLLSRWWRPQLEAALPSMVGTTIVDLRSDPYRRALPAASAHLIRINARAVVSGKRRTVSHMAKLWRGAAARHLLEDPAVGLHSNVREVTESLQRAAKAWNVEQIDVGEPVRNRAGGSLTEVVLNL